MRPYDNSVLAYSGGDLLAGPFRALAESIDSPVSLCCWLLYKYDEHEQLARKKVEPSMYNDAISFRDDYLIVSYLSKYKGLRTGLDVKAIALQSFHEAELKCQVTNARIRSRTPASPGVEAVILMAQRKIADILGPLRYDRVFEHCSWSGGATASLKEAEANPVRKMDENPISVTRGALPFLRAIMEADPAWASGICKAQVLGAYSLLDSNFKIQEWNRVTTVPKDATKDRTIAAEPTGNVFLQLGVGRFIRSRLKKHAGVDLNSQTFNQEAARIGSKTGCVATVDLKSASDTVSKLLVYEMLPLEWAELLDLLRCREGKVDDRLIRYEKFSSMGNGFTFELETLLFYALSWATARYNRLEGPTLVYGDDIALPSLAVPLLIEVLSWCGFEVNPQKTHYEGFFRESCGKHYWDGIDVSPIYQKELLHTNKRILREELYRCANRIIRLAFRRGHELWLDDKLRKPWAAVKRIIPILHAVPLDSEDDAGLALPGRELARYFISATRHGQVILPVLSFRPLEREVPPFFQGLMLAYWLRFTPSDPLRGRVAVRRMGRYVSRRRTYPVGTPDVAWL